MGKYDRQQGPYIGKVGEYIGYNHKGRHILRAYNSHPSNPRTPKQLHQRAILAALGTTLKPLNPALRIGFAQAAAQLRANGYTAAFRHNYRAGVALGDQTDITIDHQRLAISDGDGENLLHPAAASPQAGIIAITWDDNSGIAPHVLSTDLVAAAIHNPARRRAVISLAEATRGDETLSLAYPPLWAGDTVHIYIFTYSRDASSASPSDHIATLTLQ